MRSIQILGAGVLALAAEATGQVNAPVAPDAIYLARDGVGGGLSVCDLNGFGASTGDPTFTGVPAEGQTKFPFNPNVQLQGVLLRPPLAPGTTTLDGGSAGVFTLTRDAQLSDLLIAAPDVGALGDLALGHPLDLAFHGGMDPTGCQAGGGNLCAITGLKTLQIASQSQSTVKPAAPGDTVLSTLVGVGNAISFAPHPNPPPLLPVPACLDPLIEGAEPTTVDHLTGANGLPALVNLLVPGDPFGNPDVGIPPSGLLTPEQNAFFAGPSLPGVPLAGCQGYQVRQQVGHFLYAIDRTNQEIVVLNSNRMTVLDRIVVPDPTELAMAPNLDFLAVTSRATDQVFFVDTDPASATFHLVVKVTAVGDGPAGIAWEPGNEDVLVTCELDDSLVLLSAVSLNVRKVVTRGLKRPFAIAVTPRQTNFGGLRNVYYAWILNRSGRVTLFESGPDGANGWGFDDVVGVTAFALDRPAAIQADPSNLSSGVWIAHRNPVDSTGAPTGSVGGAVTRLGLAFTAFGRIPLLPGQTPSLREMSILVTGSIGPDQLTGTPTDLAFDDQRNLGALPSPQSAFGAGIGAAQNGKHLVRMVGATPLPVKTPGYLFVPVRGDAAGPGAVDVLDLQTAKRVDVNPYQPGVQSIPAPGARVVMDYFRQ